MYVCIYFSIKKIHMIQIKRIPTLEADYIQVIFRWNTSNNEKNTSRLKLANKT